MSRFRLSSVVLALALLVACGDDENPFTQFSLSRGPGEDAVLLFVSGSWAEVPGGPRELFALNADGTVDRLTTCTQNESPCNFIAVAPSSDRNRVVAIRGSVEGDPEASALYFIDLDRSVETVITPARRIQGADWARNDSFVIYSTGEVEDLRAVRPNGTEDQALSSSQGLRERNPRFDPTVSFWIYEGLSETPGKSRILAFLGQTNPEFPITEGGPGTEPLEGTPYIVGSDVSPAFQPSGQFVLFCRLTGTGNGGLGSWDLYSVNVEPLDELEPVLVTGGDELYRGWPDWGLNGRILFVETDATEGVARLVSVLPDGTDRQVLYSEDAAFGMQSPRWLR